PAPGVLVRPKMSVLYGEPSRTGPFAVRFQLPAGYEAPDGLHSTDGYLTLVSGKAWLALGDGGYSSSAEALVPGAFASLAANERYRLWTNASSVVDLHATGPFDPRGLI